MGLVHGQRLFRRRQSSTSQECLSCCCGTFVVRIGVRSVQYISMTRGGPRVMKQKQWKKTSPFTRIPQIIPQTTTRTTTIKQRINPEPYSHSLSPFAPHQLVCRRIKEGSPKRTDLHLTKWTPLETSQQKLKHKDSYVHRSLSADFLFIF